MSLSTLYTIQRTERADDSLTASVQIDPQHPVFRGHFPDMAVLPGVCQIQMVSELIAHTYGYSLALQSAASVKFLSPVLPHDNPNIDIQITTHQRDEHTLVVTAQYRIGEAVCMKFKGEYTIR